jgi:hypothetical protein
MAAQPLSIVSSQPDPLPGPLRIISSQPETPAMNRAASNWWDQVNPVEQYKALGNTLYNLGAHPLQTLTEIGKAEDKPRVDMMSAFKRGDYVEGLRHGVNWLMNMVPGVGTVSEKASDQAQAGDVAGGVGTDLGLLTNLGVAAKAPGAIAAAPDAVKAVAAGVKAGAPKVAGGATMIAGGEALGHVPGMEWPARIGMGYPGARTILQGVKEGVDAAKASWNDAVATAPEASGAAAAGPAEDAELLDKLAQGYKYKSFKSAPPEAQATFRELADRIQNPRASTAQATATTPLARSAPVSAATPVATPPVDARPPAVLQSPAEVPPATASTSPVIPAPNEGPWTDEDYAAAGHTPNPSPAATPIQASRVPTTDSASALARSLYQGGRGVRPQDVAMWNPDQWRAAAKMAGISDVRPAMFNEAQTVLKRLWAADPVAQKLKSLMGPPTAP